MLLYFIEKIEDIIGLLGIIYNNMNKILSVILLLLISTSCFGQRREFRLIEEIPSMSAMFLAGAFNGVSQDLLLKMVTHYKELDFLVLLLF